MTRARGGSVWRAVLFVAAVGLVVSAAVVWAVFPTQYEAYSLLKISAAPPSVLAAKRLDPAEFASFKATQAELVTTSMVLNGVLRDASISRLASLQGHEDNLVDWLKEQITVTFPDDAEVMRVAVSMDSPDDAVEVAEKVTEIYLKEIVQYEKSQQMAHESKLQRAFEQLSADYKRELDSLVALERIHKTSGSEAAQIKKTLALQELGRLGDDRQQITQAIRENELAIAIDKARTELDAENRTADSVSLSRQAGDTLPLPLLEKRREFLEKELSLADARIQAKVDELAGLESFSAQVTAKKDELEAMRRQKQELGEAVEKTRIERLARDRISVIDRAQLADAPNFLRRNMIIGSLAAFGMLAGVLGLVVGRRADGPEPGPES